MSSAVVQLYGTAAVSVALLAGAVALLVVVARGVERVRRANQEREERRE